MGLDMYVHGRKNGSEEWEELVYWRKANMIHGWFDRLAAKKNGHAIDNCEDVKVTKEDLVNLLNDCKTVLANHSLAYTLLPTRSGFFFGQYDYGEFYYYDVSDTMKKLKTLLARSDIDDLEMAYHAWW